MDIIKQYGTPLKITYLPKITSQIQRAKRLFNVAMAKVDYKGSYNYCYCTKSSHFSFVLEEALKNDINLETSSAYDIHIIDSLYDSGIVDKGIFIICNGFKRPQYVENIASLIHSGFENTIPIVDNKEELDLLDSAIHTQCKIGIRIASEEEPKFDFYTSRLGIRYNDIVEYYKGKIKNNKKFTLKMLHFFINTGICPWRNWRISLASAPGRRNACSSASMARPSCRKKRKPVCPPQPSCSPTPRGASPRLRRISAIPPSSIFPRPSKITITSAQGSTGKKAFTTAFRTAAQGAAKTAHRFLPR